MCHWALEHFNWDAVIVPIAVRLFFFSSLGTSAVVPNVRFVLGDPFVSLNAAIAIPPHTLFLPCPCLRVWHGQPLNGLQIHAEKKSRVPPPPPRPSLSQKTKTRHTMLLMAALGSATKVSLNRLVHHFGFVHHDRELCVHQWSSSTLCFYPQMDVPFGWALTSKVPT